MALMLWNTDIPSLTKPLLADPTPPHHPATPLPLADAKTAGRHQHEPPDVTDLSPSQGGKSWAGHGADGGPVPARDCSGAGGLLHEVLISSHPSASSRHAIEKERETYVGADVETALTSNVSGGGGLLHEVLISSHPSVSSRHAGEMECETYVGADVETALTSNVSGGGGRRLHEVLISSHPSVSSRHAGEMECGEMEMECETYVGVGVGAAVTSKVSANDCVHCQTQQVQSTSSSGLNEDRSNASKDYVASAVIPRGGGGRGGGSGGNSVNEQRGNLCTRYQNSALLTPSETQDDSAKDRDSARASTTMSERSPGQSQVCSRCGRTRNANVGSSGPGSSSALSTLAEELSEEEEDVETRQRSDGVLGGTDLGSGDVLRADTVILITAHACEGLMSSGGGEPDVCSEDEES